MALNLSFTRGFSSALVSLLAAGSLAMGCTSPRTEVIVAVEADAIIRPLIDSLQIDIASPSGDLRSASADLDDGVAMPRTLGLYWSGGSLGPYRVNVTARRGSSTVITRDARFSFVRDETRVLRILLTGSCLGTTCRPSQTCGEEGCRSLDVAENELEPWTGSFDRVDAGSTTSDAGALDGGSPDGGSIDAAIARDAFVPTDAFVPRDAFVPPDAFVPTDAFVPRDAFVPTDAFVRPDAFTAPDAFVRPDAFTAPDAFVPPDAPTSDTGCVPSAEVCNGLDDDCDGDVDEGFDLDTDVDHCGACGRVCTVPRGTPACVAGSCDIASCDAGYADCNDRLFDGCETNTRTSSLNCGSCGNRCTGGRHCEEGMCVR